MSEPMWVAECPENPGIVHVGVGEDHGALTWMDALRMAHDLLWAGLIAASRADVSQETLARVLKSIGGPK